MLKKNLYGLRDAGRTWWEHLSEGLIDLGFHKIETDQCVFIKEDFFILIYVDNCVISSKNKESISKKMELIKKGYTITDK